MARARSWIGQAESVFAVTLPPDYIDPYVPDLASIKFIAQLIATQFTHCCRRTGDPVVIFDQARAVRVWFTATAEEVIGWGLDVSLAGTWADPLARYREFVQPDENEDG
jgi:hypothetical protein